MTDRTFHLLWRQPKPEGRGFYRARVYRYFFDGQREQSGFTLRRWIQDRIDFLTGQGWVCLGQVSEEEARREDARQDGIAAALIPQMAQAVRSERQAQENERRALAAGVPRREQETFKPFLLIVDGKERRVGKLCPLGHQHGATGGSLRDTRSGHCLDCKRLEDRRKRERRKAEREAVAA